MIQLETYKGTKSRHTCPACNARNQFTRFINTDTGEYLPESVGVCNRSSKCGYRYTAKEFFRDNPTDRTERGEQTAKGKKRGASNYGFANSSERQTSSIDVSVISSPDFIPFEMFRPTLSNYDGNAFVQFLFDLFPDCSEEIQAVLKMHFFGTCEDYTCFPQIDRLNRVCKAKLIRFNRETGKRLKGEFDTSSLVAKLKKQGKVKAEFNYKQIFFGEHLLPKYPNKPAAIVEAEKTAIIASLCFPEKLWLATGSKQWLNAARLQRLDNRQIILYPDADGFDLWQGIALDAARQGLTVKTSALIENHATDEQKANGYDLADYLINQQKEINELNEVYDAYNSKVDLVLNNDSLFNGFKLFFEERKAIAIYNGESEADAERICTQPENLRSVIMSI